MELKLIVNATHVGENIFSIKLPKFPVNTILIVYTEKMFFLLRQQIVVMGILTMGISGEKKKTYKTGFKREYLYFIVIIFPQNSTFSALESATMGTPKKGCESESLQ